MTYRIEDIEGIGPVYRDRLREVGIDTTGQLLEACCTAEGRKKIGKMCGIGEKQLLNWTNMADLMRVSGIGRQFAELLEASGVDTIKELRTRNPENLAEKLKQVNAEKRLSRTSPGVPMTTRWIEQASRTQPKISH